MDGVRLAEYGGPSDPPVKSVSYTSIYPQKN